MSPLLIAVVTVTTVLLSFAMQLLGLLGSKVTGHWPEKIVAFVLGIATGGLWGVGFAALYISTQTPDITWVYVSQGLIVAGAFSGIIRVVAVRLTLATAPVYARVSSTTNHSNNPFAPPRSDR